MASGFGFSRDIPLAGENAYGQPGQGRPAAGGGPQEAVQVRSLRLPEYSSPSALAPLPLLQSPGGAAGGLGGLDALIGALVQLFRGGGVNPQGSGMAPQGGGVNPQGSGMAPQGGGINPQMPFRPAPQAFGRQPGPLPPPRIIPREEDGQRPTPVPLPSLPTLPPIKEELPPAPGKIDIGGNVPGIDVGIGHNPRGPDFFGGFPGRRGTLFPID